MGRQRKKYYHATSEDNLISILSSGLKVGPDHRIYLTAHDDEAVRFLLFRGVEKVITFEITVPDMKKLEESFDHSYEFFKCKCFAYPENIGPEYIKPFKKYDLSGIL